MAKAKQKTNQHLKMHRLIVTNNYTYNMGIKKGLNIR